jgi:paraquat-inducible protein B
MDTMVARGMRATLQSGNLLTGQKYVALAFDDKAAPDEIKRGQFYAVFPTSSTQVEELSKLALGIAEDVKTTLSSISRFMESRQLDKTVDGMNKVLEETEATVVAAREAMQDVSRLLAKIESETLPVLTGDASRVLRQLDQTTLPAISNNVNRLGNDVSQVMKRVDEQTLPTLARGVNQLTQDSSQVLQQVNKETLPAIRSSSGTINKASTDFSRSTHELNKTMQRLQGTLGHVDRLLAQNSPTQHQMLEMMEEITAMARSVRLLTEQLERQPESVLRGKRELK